MNTLSIKCEDAVVDRSVSTGVLSTIRAAIGQKLKTIVSQWNVYRQNKINRQAFQSVLTLDDHILRDIGVTRIDVLWANKLPLSYNAAIELNNLSKKQRQTSTKD